MHEPPCASWEAHVEKAYADIRDGDDYNLLAFADFLIHTWDNERLAADPEFPLFLAAQSGSAMDPCQGREGAGLERALPSTPRPREAA